jgi:hypothetical protein
MSILKILLACPAEIADGLTYFFGSENTDWLFTIA